MILEIILLVGIAIAGYLLPEYFLAVGGGSNKIPQAQNVASSVSAVLIASCFIFGG